MSADRVRFVPLGKDNFDTWKIQAEALLIKSDGWSYVDGSCKKPALVADNDANRTAIAKWELADRKARSDLILSINASELRKIKGCQTSREMWLKLETIYQSKGPARKATLLKQLTLSKMKEGGDVRQHLDQFFSAVDKLSEMDLEVNDDLLAIMLLYSLPASFENFRCAIESRDELPKPEALKIKILEEADARQNKEEDVQSDALFARRQKGGKQKKFENSKSEKPFKFKCNRCKKVGHKAADCRAPLPTTDAAGNAEEIVLHNSTENEAAYLTQRWCLDSGATSHMTANSDYFTSLEKTSKILNLANNQRTDIEGVGDIQMAFGDGQNRRRATLTQILYVPDLRTNLMSVSKMTDKGHKVIFKKDAAYV